MALSCVAFSAMVCLQAFAGDIAIYGDSQHNPEDQRRLVQAIRSFEPSIVFRVGDIVDNGNDPKLWEAFRDIHGPLLTTTEYFPSLGNHENDSPLYFANFPSLHNQRWYSVDRHGIHFIVLDSNSALQPGSPQYTWLLGDLQEHRDGVRFKIALFHHPLFSVGSHRDDEKGLRPVLLPLFQRYGVSAVFSGHDHSYQRFSYQGIFFIVTGGGGSFLRERSRESPYLQRYHKTYHFCLLIPGENALLVKVFDSQRELLDSFRIGAPVVSSRQTHEEPVTAVSAGGDIPEAVPMKSASGF